MTNLGVPMLAKDYVFTYRDDYSPFLKPDSTMTIAEYAWYQEELIFGKSIESYPDPPKLPLQMPVSDYHYYYKLVMPRVDEYVKEHRFYLQ